MRITGNGIWGEPADRAETIRVLRCGLRLDRIDLYQLHRIDPDVPAEDQLGALKALQAEGKIRHIGLSEVNVRQLQHAQTIVVVASVQNRYSVIDRG